MALPAHTRKLSIDREPIIQYPVRDFPHIMEKYYCNRFFTGFTITEYAIMSFKCNEIM